MAEKQESAEPQKILLAEDNDQTRALFRKFFEKAQERKDIDCEIREAKDGDEACLKLDSDFPDILLCDIDMPGKDGFQVLYHLRNIRSPVAPYCLFVFLSASPEEKKRAFLEGADGFIAKNEIDYYTFTLQLQTWLRIALLERERDNYV